MSDERISVNPWDVVMSRPDLSASLARSLEAEAIRLRILREGLEKANNSPEIVEKALELDALRDRSNTPEEKRKYLGIRWVNAVHDQISMGVAAFSDDLDQSSYQAIFREAVGSEFGIIFMPVQVESTQTGLVDGDNVVLYAE